MNIITKGLLLITLLTSLKVMSSEYDVKPAYEFETHPLITKFLDENPEIYDELNAIAEKTGEDINYIESIKIKDPNFFAPENALESNLEKEECFTSANFVIRFGSTNRRRRISIFQNSFGFYKDSNCPDIQVY